MPRGYDYDWWEQHGPRLPAQGIRAKTQRGAFGKTWWAGRWIAALERLVDPARLARGRSYARSGQVTKLEVGPGKVTARVQGSRPTPYKVSISFRALSDAEWGRVIDAMADQAIYAARLLSGEMPEQIEEVFQQVGASLLPATGGDMETDCSCPDWANPCKHVAAVHYLLGEQFDEDPFLMFLLRGRSKEQVLEALRERRAGPAAEESGDAEEAETATAPDLAAFWTAPRPVDVALRFALPEQDALVVKRLGPPTFARDPQAFTARLERLYRAISAAALLLAMGDTRLDEGAPDEGM